MDELSVANAVLASLLRNAPLGFAVYSPDFRYLMVNEQLTRMNGRSAEEHLGRSIDEVVPDLAEQGRALLGEVLRTGHPIVDVEVTGETAADPGRTHHWMESFYRVTAPDGRVIGVAAIARDVTEERHLRERLEAEQRAAIEEGRRRVEALQRAFLPRAIGGLDGVEVAAVYRSADHGVTVGGDWYDAIPVRDGRLLLCVGDVAGHGVEAVEVMGVARIVARAYGSEDPSPDRVLDRMAAYLRAVPLPYPDVLLTMVAATLEPRSGRFRWATAGHLPPLVVGPDGPRLLRAPGGPPLGFFHTTHRAAEVVVPPGSLVVLYTDGLLERRDEPLTAGLDRLLRVAASLPADPAEACAALLEGCVSGEPEDDVCVLAVRVDE